MAQNRPYIVMVGENYFLPPAKVQAFHNSILKKYGAEGKPYSIKNPENCKAEG